MAILSTAKIVGMLASAKKTGQQVMNTAGQWAAEVVEDFTSGFAGHGWKIWEYISGRWILEIDDIRVRGTMTIFELLIQKIRAIKGALGITQACGKIKTAVLDSSGENWLITIEDEMSFIAHDFIRCQDWQGNTLKGYWVEISHIDKIDGADTIVIPVSEFTGNIGYVNGMETVKADLSGMATPAVGDEIVQFGNSVHTNRQSAIYLHADESGQPAIDILFGIHSKSFAGCVKQRMGGDIPGSDGLRGFYCENGMIKGVDDGGHTVYCIYPNGTAEFGDGSARFATDKSGYIAGGAISWQWDAERKKYVCTMKDMILTWDNLSDETKENLKGEPGTDGKTTYTWIAYSDHANGIGMYQVPTSDTRYIGIAVNKDIATESNTPTDYVWSLFKGDKGDKGESGDITNLPWLSKWNGYATELGEEYIVTPKMFSGTLSEDGKLTGIAQGKECLTDAVTGEKRTGIFALVDDEVVFELDPVKKKYKFTGEINATSGKIGSISIIGNDLVGLDSTGTERVRFSIGNVPSVNSSFEVSSVPFELTSTDKTVSCSVSDSSGHYAGQTERFGRYIVDRDNPRFDIEDIHYPILLQFTISETSQKISFARFYTRIDTKTGTLDGEPYLTGYLYRETSSGWVSVATFPDFMSEESYDVLLAQIGNYKLELRAGITFQNEDWSGLIYVTMTEVCITKNKMPHGTTTLAKDGILCMQDSSKYLYFSGDTGFEARFGNFGIKVDSAGLQKMVNNSWITL